MEEQIKWWDALDRLGWSFAECLNLARKCLHPDARWLCSLFPLPSEGNVTPERALALFQSLGEDDARVLFFRSRIHSSEYWLRRSAAMGYAPAQGLLPSIARECNDVFELAQSAAAQGDRNGLACLAWCYWTANGCVKDPDKAKALWKEAADLGNHSAQHNCGVLTFAENDWRRYHWLGKAAAGRGFGRTKPMLLAAARKYLDLHRQGQGSGRVLFEIGLVFKGHVDVEKCTIFGAKTTPDMMPAVLGCIQAHDEFVLVAKEAIECWIAVGRRLRKFVSKDIRLMIARLLWEQRAEWSE